MKVSKEEKRWEKLSDNPNYSVKVTDKNIEAITKYPFLVIDCRAEWCGPCGMIVPIIKKPVKDHKGDTVFGTLDVTSNYDTSSRFNIRSISNSWFLKMGELG